MPKETGRIGVKRYGGRFYEEFLRELQGINGVRVYEEMSENDDIVGAILFSIKMLIRQVDWSVHEIVYKQRMGRKKDSRLDSKYSDGIAMTVLADFIFLGHQSTGSWALSSDKTELFALACGAYLDIICEVFNRKAIPQLISMNGSHFDGLTDYPKLIHGDIETQDLEKLGAFVERMTGTGIITPDEGIEDYLRRQAGLPERVEEFSEINNVHFQESD